MSSDLILCTVGKTGIGRSTLLNSILAKEAFRTAAQDGRVTTAVDVEHGFFLGNKDIKTICIDTPGLIEKTSPNRLGEQISYENFITFIESLSKGFNVIMLCFDVNNIRFDANTIQILEFLSYLFGEDVFNHLAFVFTMCDASGAEDNIKKVKETFYHDFRHALKTTAEPPMFFTKKQSTQDLESLGKFALKVGKYDCKFLQDLKKIQEDDTKTKLDQDKYIEELFKLTILKVLQCNIL